MIVRFMMVSFTDVEFSPTEIPKLRGYFSHLYPGTHQFHNHLPDNTLNYEFPKIQYRIIDPKL